MYIYIYIYIYVCTYICIYVYMYICIYISTQVIKDAHTKFQSLSIDIPFLHIHHEPQIDAINGYYKLSSHFKWALNQVCIFMYIYIYM
jgi:hypothetical protein